MKLISRSSHFHFFSWKISFYFVAAFFFLSHLSLLSDPLKSVLVWGLFCFLVFCISLLFVWKGKSLSLVWLFVTPWTIQSMDFSRPDYWSGQPFPSPGDLPNPGIKPRSLALQTDSVPAEPQGKPKNTGVGSLSLLQQIFLTQESNWGLLHCRWILYPMSC